MKCSWITPLTCILGDHFLNIFFLLLLLSFKVLIFKVYCWLICFDKFLANLLCYLSVSIAVHFLLTGVIKMIITDNFGLMED